MSKRIEIRRMPEVVHRRLKARAAREGLTLSDYLLREIRRTAERPTLAELLARLARGAPVRLDLSPARTIPAERERR